MQDLRDKLLKAGVVDKQRARIAKQEVRREHKGLSADRGTKRNALQKQLAEQQERYEAKLATDAEHARTVQAALNRERAAQEELARIRQFIRKHARARMNGEDRPFYVLGRDRRIRKCMISFEHAHHLSQGDLVIVEVDDDPARDYAFIDAPSAYRLESFARDRILFWSKRQDREPASNGPPDDGFDNAFPVYGSGLT